jgi:FkbM family methyltransferase
MPSAFHHIQGLARAVGVFSTASILVRRALGYAGPVSVCWSSGSRESFAIRPTGSDLFVASQIFGWEDYQLSDEIVARLNGVAKSWRAGGDIPVVLDGGANAGYSSIYFANKFPDACVIAIEPDPNTFAMLKENTSRHERIKPVNGALWRDENGVELKHVPKGAWSTSVVPSSIKGSVPSWRIEQILRSIPRGRVLVLKLDIEGAERQVCEASPDIIRLAPCVMIEPHDYDRPGLGCLAPLYRAISGKEVDTLVQSDIMILLDSALCTISENGKL